MLLLARASLETRSFKRDAADCDHFAVERRGNLDSPMKLKNPQLQLASATARALIEGECPSCYRLIRRPLDAFKRSGYQCECRATLASPDDLDELLDSAIKKEAWRRQSRFS